MFAEKNEQHPEQFDRILPRLLATRLTGEALHAVNGAHENALTTLLSTGDERAEDD